MNGLSSSARVPKEGIEVGQKWSSERPIEGVALGGLIWRNQSTYLARRAVQLNRWPAEIRDCRSAR